jgi:hypothetical protein
VYHYIQISALVILLLACGPLICGFKSSSAQSIPRTTTDQFPGSQRTITGSMPRNVPIRIKIRNLVDLKDRQNENWVRDFALDVKNTSDKPIYFVLFTLSMPDVPGPHGVPVGFQLFYGRYELLEVGNAKAKPGDVPIKPGETVVLKPEETNIEGWESFKSQNNVKVPELRIVFRTLNFGDGTGFIDSAAIPNPKRAIQR